MRAKGLLLSEAGSESAPQGASDLTVCRLPRIHLCAEPVLQLVEDCARFGHLGGWNGDGDQGPSSGEEQTRRRRAQTLLTRPCASPLSAMIASPRGEKGAV